jgi:hypothetical protein
MGIAPTLASQNREYCSQFRRWDGNSQPQRPYAVARARLKPTWMERRLLGGIR